MAYEKMNWKDRIVERPNTFRAQNNPDGTVTQIPEPGTIIQAGTPLSATILNQREEKIKEEFDNISSQLADVTTLSDVHGVVGNRAVNESPFIQAAIDYAVSAKINKLVFPKRTYRIENPIYFRKSIEVDFSGSTFEWYGQGTINANIWGEIGMFNVRGELDYQDQDIISYVRSLAGNHAPPSTAPQLLTLEQVNDPNVSFEYKTGSKIKTSNNSHFSVGDDILLMGWTRAAYMPYDSTKFEPELRVLAKVVNIDATYVYVDYYTPIKYPAFVTTTRLKSVAMKVKLVDNVTLKNFKIKDMISRPLGEAATDVDKKDTPAGVVELLSINTKIENYEMENHRFNALFCQYNLNASHKNIKAKNPQWWAGGQGYVIQLAGCRGIQNENIFGYACRHVIDVSWSNDIHTKKASSSMSKYADFTHHGCTEHDIYWDNVHGEMSFNHGIQYFPEIIQNVTVENSDIRIKDVSLNGYSGNILYKNSKVTAYGFAIHNQVTYENCNLDVFYTMSGDAPAKRGLSEDIKASVIGGKINLYAVDSSRTFLGFYDIDKVLLDSVEIIINDTSFTALGSTRPRIQFSNFKKVTVLNCDFEKANLAFRQTKYASCIVNVEKCKGNFIPHPIGTFFIDLANITNTDLKLNMVANDVFYTQSGGVGYIQVLKQNPTITNSNLFIKMLNNNFFGSGPNSVHDSNTAVGTGTVVTKIDKDNIIKNKHPGATFSANNVTV
jgi:hypothetical protein